MRYRKSVVLQGDGSFGVQNKVISLDCGSTTGVVLVNGLDSSATCWEVSSDWEWPANEFRIVSFLENLISSFEVEICILEDFMLRVGVVSHKREVLSSPRIAFAIYCLVGFLGEKRGTKGSSISCKWQSPSSALSTFNDVRLKEMGFWVPGSDHCRDAMRHYLLFMRLQKRSAAAIKIGKVQKIKV